MRLLNFLVKERPNVGDVYRLRTKYDFFCMVEKVENGMVYYTKIYKNDFARYALPTVKYYIYPDYLPGNHVDSVYDFCKVLYTKVPNWSEKIYDRSEVLQEFMDTF